MSKWNKSPQINRVDSPKTIKETNFNPDDSKEGKTVSIESDKSITPEMEKLIYEKISTMTGLTAHDLAIMIFGPSGKPKDINTYLYGNKIYKYRKETEAAPLWIVNPVYTKFRKYLENVYVKDTFVFLTELCRIVSVKSLELNPVLYSMQNRGLAEKVCEVNMTKPRWKFFSSSF